MQAEAIRKPITIVVFRSESLEKAHGRLRYNPGQHTLLDYGDAVPTPRKTRSDYGKPRPKIHVRLTHGAHEHEPAGQREVNPKTGKTITGGQFKPGHGVAGEKKAPAHPVIRGLFDYPEEPAHPYQDIYDAVKALSRRCDGARENDGQGFNKLDAHWKDMADLPAAEWTPGMFHNARKMLQRYGGQLKGLGIDPAKLPTVQEFEGYDGPQEPKEETGQQRTSLVPETEQKEGYYRVNGSGTAFVEGDGIKREKVRVYGSEGTGRLKVYFDYDRNLVDRVKQVPGRSFDSAGKFWTVPLSSYANLIRSMGSVAISDKALALVNGHQEQAQVQVEQAQAVKDTLAQEDRDFKSSVLGLSEQEVKDHPSLSTWEKEFLSGNLGKSTSQLSAKQLPIVQRIQASHDAYLRSHPEAIKGYRESFEKRSGEKLKAAQEKIDRERGAIEAQASHDFKLPDSPNREVLQGGDLFEHQKAGANWLLTIKRGILAYATGLGKSLSDDAMVLTPTGWRRNGNLIVGDWVIAGDGTATRIRGVFPQGVIPIYRVEFSDGSSVEASGDHLWLTTTRTERIARGRGYPSIPARRTTEEVASSLRVTAGGTGTTWNHSIPMTEPVEFEPRDVPISPYLIGALLGDGSFVGRSVRFSSVDDGILKLVKDLLPEGCELKFVDRCNYRITGTAMLCALRQLGMTDEVSNSKAVPRDYLFNTSSVRLGVLQGLMDTDGYCCDIGVTTQFNSVSEQLANDVMFLVQSFGGTATIKSKIPTYVYNGERRSGQRAYTVHIDLPAGINPFRLPRKAQRVRPRTKYPPCRYITGVVPVGDKSATCIMVDHPSHLYLTEHFIVTHNTNVALSAFETLREKGEAKRMLWVVPKARLYGTQRDIDALFPGRKVVVVAGTPAQRAKQIEAAKDADYVICGYDMVRRSGEELKGLNIDVFCADECTRIKGKNSQVALSARETFKGTPNVWYVSATPIPNSPEDLYYLMKGINPELFGTLTQFKKEHCNTQYNRFSKGWDITGYKDRQATSKACGPYMMYRNYQSEDVNVSMPPRVDAINRLDMGTDQAKAYNSLRVQFLNEAQEQGEKSFRSDMAITNLLRLEQMSISPRLLEKGWKGDEPKLAETVNLIHDHFANGEGQAAIVFSHFVGVQPLLKEHLAEAGISPREVAEIRGNEYVIGGKTVKSAQDVVDAVNSGQVKVLLASDAAAEGLNLQHKANLTIHLDTPWRPDIMEQRDGRTYRPGQKNRSFFVTMRMKNGVEALKERVVGQKAADMKVILEGGEAEELPKLSYQEYLSALKEVA